MIALTREVSPTIGGCELTHLARFPIDVPLARRQHDTYTATLSSLGCRIVPLPAEPDLPDAVFVEDVAVVLDEIAVVTYPGAASRRAERRSVAVALAPYRELVFLSLPATLDGGDVLRTGRTLWVGASGRTNAAGIDALTEAAAPHGYRVVPAPVRGCLHLKSAVTQVGDRTLLIQPAFVDPAIFEGFDLVEVDPSEPHAANALLVGGRVVHSSSHPRTRERLEAAGARVIPVEVSEIEKAEGAVTCCSLVFDERGASS